jgi:hypothetical protein
MYLMNRTSGVNRGAWMLTMIHAQVNSIIRARRRN